MTTPLQQAKANAAALVAYLETLTPVVVSPPPTPPAPPVTTPPTSALVIPPVAGGFTRSQDLFKSTTLGPLWGAPPYSGKSGGALDGLFIASHTVLKGDGLLRLEAYPDPVNIVKSYQYSAALAASVNQWGGAGVQTKESYPVGTTFHWIAKADVYPGVTPIALTFGNDAEQDFFEMTKWPSGLVKGEPVTSLTPAFIWQYTPTRLQEQITITNADFSQEHVYRAEWTETGTILYVDGVEVGSVKWTSANQATMTKPQPFCLQIQTGDPTNPPADPTISALDPVTFYVSAVAIDVPA